ncbi:MAG: type IV secretion system DNA-binding domain-containing protein [Solirubrobacteraceae bacterium]
MSNFAGITRPVAITPTASTRGLYLLGPTGTGKTSLLKNLIRDDMEQGRGICVIETNGDLIADTLEITPRHRYGDVVLLDPTDKEYAVGFNPLAGSGDSALVADQIVELFERLWKSYWGPRTAQIAHLTLFTLARQRGAATLLDVARLLTDPGFRAATVGRLDDPLGLEPDWAWFSGLSDAERDNVSAPLRNKLRQFTARPAIRAIVGQQPKITMQRIMEDKKILLVNLPKGLIGAETAKLLGCLVLTSLWQVATERARLPLSRRHPFSLVVDEWQDFAAAPIPWADMASQGRKYGLALTVAHQNTQQIERGLLETILANARSKTVFALSATDARVMERLFAPSLTAADLMALDAYSVAALVALDDGSTARPVTLTTPPPPEATGSGEQVREASRANYARLRTEVEAELRRRVIPELPAGPLGSKPRTP